MPQQYSNHIRFYYPHHFVFYPIVALLTGTSTWMIFARPEHRPEWIFITLLLILSGWLSYMMRQHYALTLQDRVVRLEMRLRYYQLTQQTFEPLERQLSFGQLAALRFAADAELIALVERALREDLSPAAIKQAIVHWQSDEMRV